MEFSDTYRYMEYVKRICEEKKIDFLVSSSKTNPLDTWKEFGPPSMVIRWCCSVHKTAPQILLLRKITKKPNFTGMAFVGIRADESFVRSQYDYETYGGKHSGQYSYNVISSRILRFILSHNTISFLCFILPYHV